MPPALVPLRIPSGWAVLFNIFVDLPDSTELGAADIDSYLSDDILSIQQVRLAGDRWETDPDGVLIDISWSEPGRANGEYVLSVVFGNWDGPTVSYRHRTVNRIREAIDRALDQPLSPASVPRISALFQRMTIDDDPSGGPRSG